MRDAGDEQRKSGQEEGERKEINWNGFVSRMKMYSSYLDNNFPKEAL